MPCRDPRQRYSSTFETKEGARAASWRRASDKKFLESSIRWSGVVRSLFPAGYTRALFTPLSDLQRQTKSQRIRVLAWMIPLNIGGRDGRHGARWIREIQSTDFVSRNRVHLGLADVRTSSCLSFGRRESRDLEISRFVRDLGRFGSPVKICYSKRPFT